MDQFQQKQDQTPAPDILASVLPEHQVDPIGTNQKKFPFALVGGAAFVLIMGIAVPLMLVKLTSKSAKPERLVAVQPAVIVPTLAPPNPDVMLTVITPLEGDVTLTNSVEISGKTIPGASIAAFTDISDAVTDTDSAGNFNMNLDLADGINTITMTAFSQDGSEKSVTVNVLRDTQ